MPTNSRHLSLPIATLAISFGAAVAAHAATLANAGFTTNSLAANDDGSTGLVPIGFNLNFFGTTYSSLYVNNNGNVTFDNPLSQFTPTGITAASDPILAPFFADVDTQGAGSSEVTYGFDSVGGQAAFGVNWIDVGYFPSQADKLNQFQLVLVDRSDISAGDFDIQFNYGDILWETGSASGGSNGFGGDSAGAGYSNGAGTSFELSGSRVNGAFLDGGNFDLNDQNYVFEVRNGIVIPPMSAIPEPAQTLSLALLIFGGLVGNRSRRS